LQGRAFPELRMISLRSQPRRTAKRRKESPLRILAHFARRFVVTILRMAPEVRGEEKERKEVRAAGS